MTPLSEMQGTEANNDAAMRMRLTGRCFVAATDTGMCTPISGKDCNMHNE